MVSKSKLQSDHRITFYSHYLVMGQGWADSGFWGCLLLNSCPILLEAHISTTGFEGHKPIFCSPLYKNPIKFYTFRSNKKNIHFLIVLFFWSIMIPQTDQVAFSELACSFFLNFGMCLLSSQPYNHMRFKC